MPVKPRIDVVLLLDLAGIFVFAIQGASAAAAGHLDPLGVLVLSFAASLGGGVVRDLLIGEIPPSAIRDWRYPAMAFVGGAVVMLTNALAAIPSWLLIGLDAAGLSLFAMAGARRALARGISPFVAVLMAGITGAGGGVIRDLLLARVPTVLHSDIYVVAAMFGALLMVLAQKLRAPPAFATWLGMIACFALRLVAVWRNWNLPRF